MPDLLAVTRVAPGDRRPLHRPTAATYHLRDKEHARAALDRAIDELSVLQNHLWAENRQALLVVLQGMDASGKDGTIRRVFTGVNPQGCVVSSFKAPTDEELDHDYLWRIHARCPRRGEIGIFNRSHYEDLVTVRVEGRVTAAEAKRRVRHVVEFERMLHEEGTRIVKVFLHISRQEQRERLQRRLDDPEKRWKFNPADLDARRRWTGYRRAYAQAIGATSTRTAPWFVVPADHKWVRDVVVATILVRTLRSMNPQLPPDPPGLDGVRVE